MRTRCHTYKIKTTQHKVRQLIMGGQQSHSRLPQEVADANKAKAKG